MDEYNIDAEGMAPEEPTGGETGEESSTSEKPEVADERMVSYSRFKEVYGKMKELERKVDTISERRVEQGITKQTPEEAQAREYLKNLQREVLEEHQKESSAREQRELEEFKTRVDDVLEVYHDVKRSDFLTFIEEKANSYGIESVDGAMKLYRDLNNMTKEASEKAKREMASKPSLPRSDGTPRSAPADDKGKSIYQIAEEVKRNLKT